MGGRGRGEKETENPGVQVAAQGTERGGMEVRTQASRKTTQDMELGRGWWGGGTKIREPRHPGGGGGGTVWSWTWGV